MSITYLDLAMVPLFSTEHSGIPPVWSRGMALRPGLYDGGKGVSLRMMELNLEAPVMSL